MPKMPFSFSRNNPRSKKLILPKQVVIFSVLLILSSLNNSFSQKTWVGAAGAAWGTAGNWSPTGAPTSADAVTINAGSTPVVSAAGAVCASIQINNSTANGVTTSLTINSGFTLTVGATGNGIVTIGNGGTGMASGAVSTTSIIVNGNLNCGNINQQPSVRNAGSGGTGNDILTINSTGIVTVTGNVTGSNVTDTRGPVATASVIFSGTGTLNVTGTFTTSVFTPSTGIVNYNGPALQTLNSAYTTYGTLKINNSVGVTLTAATAVNNLIIGDIKSGSIFNDGGYQVNSTGTLTFTSGTFNLGSGGTATSVPAFTTATFSSGTTVNFNSTSSQTIPAFNFANITNTANGPRVLASSGTIGVSGSYTPGSGGYTITGSTIAFNGSGAQTIPAFNYNNLTVTNSGTNITLANSGTIGVAGTFTPGATSFGTITSSTVIFNGTAPAQTIPAFTFNNLQVNNTAGISSIGGNVTVNQNFALTNGIVTTGANTIISPSANVTRSGGWVNGNLQQMLNATGSIIFPVGGSAASTYRPVSVNVTTLTTAGYLTVTQLAGFHPQIAGSGLDNTTPLAITPYWTLTSGGFAGVYSSTFTFQATDRPVGTDGLSYVIRQYDGSNWSTTTLGSALATSTSETNLNSFGSFVIGQVRTIAVTTQPVDRTICQASSTTFTAASTSIPAPSVKWQRSSNGGSTWVDIDGTLDGSIYTNFTTNTLNISSTPLTLDGYLYRAVYSNINGTVNSNAKTLTITTQPSATITYINNPFGSTDTNPDSAQITGTAGGTFSYTGPGTLNSFTAAKGKFTPSGSGLGTYTVIYTIAASGGCAVYTTNTSLTITAAPTADINYGTAGQSYLCTSSTNQPVSITGTGAYTGGSYSYTPAVPGNTLTIDASSGAITPSTSTAGDYTVKYTIPPSAPYASSVTTTLVTITTVPTVLISYPGGPFCTADASPNAVSISGTGAFSGGIFSSTPLGLSINASTGAITPSLSTGGVTYKVTYTGIASGGCAAPLDSTNISIATVPAATLTYSLSSYCRAYTTPQSATLTGASGGTFSYTSASGTGILTLNTTTGAITPSTSTADDYTIIYTIPASGPCGVVQVTTNISIVESPTGSIDYAGQPFCASGGTRSVTFIGGTGAFSGGAYSATPSGLTINATTGDIQPASSIANNYTVSYTTLNCLATFTAAVEITVAPTATISYAAAGSPFCSSDGAIKSVQLVGDATGAFSGPSGLSISSDGDITPSTSTPGTYTVTYTIPPQGTCSSVFKTTSVTITGLPTATISYDGSPYCNANSLFQAVTRTGTYAFTTGTYASTPTGLTMNGGGAIQPSASAVGTYNVTYTIAAAGGCPAVTAFNSLTIVAPSTAPTTIASDAAGNTICAGGSTVLSVTGGNLRSGATIRWYTGSCGSTLVGTGSSISVNPSVTTVYFVRYEDGSPCNTNTACLSITILVNQFSADPTSATTSAPSNTICFGASTTLSLSGGGGGTSSTIRWYSGSCGGTLVGSGNNLVVSPSSTTTYFGRYEDGSPCSVNSNCASVTVTVNPQLVAGSIGSAQSICYNTIPAGLTSLASPTGGTGSYTYQWQSSPNNSTWTNVSGATLDTYAPGTLTTPTYYRRNETSGTCGTVSSTSIFINVYNQVTGGVIASNQTVCSNVTPAAFTVTTAAGGGDGTYAYQWQSSLNNSTWTDISGANAATYSPGLRSVTTYFRRNVTSAGCTTVSSNTVTLTITGLLLTSAAGTDDQIVCAATGSGNKVVSNTITSITYSVPSGTTSISPAGLPAGLTLTLAGGVYTISGKANSDVTGTFNYTLTVNGGTCPGASTTGRIRIFTGAGDINAIRNGGKCGARIDGTPVTCPNGNPATYFWTQTDNTGTYVVKDSVGEDLYPSGDATKYKYTRTAICGSCIDSVRMNQPVSAYMQVTSFVRSNVLCFGQSTGSVYATIAGGLKPFTYTWTNGGGTTVQTTNLTQLFSDTVFNIPAGTYIVQVKDSGNCTDNSLAVTVTQPTQPTATIAGTTTVCQLTGSNIVFTGSGGMPSYNYTYNIDGGSPITTTPAGSPVTVVAPNTTSGTFVYNLVSVTDANNCTFPVTPAQAVTVTVNPTPIVSNISRVICSGNSFDATPVNVTDGLVPTGTVYTWTAPVVAGITGTVSGSNSSTITGALTNTTNAPVNVVYTVTPRVLSPLCVGASFTVTVTVNPRPAIPNQVQAICSGNTFSVVPQNGVPTSATIVPTDITYTWSAALPAGITGTASGTTNVATGITGTLTNSTNAPIDVIYNVTTSSAYGPCSGTSFTVTITVNPRPAIPNQAAVVCSLSPFSVVPQNGVPDAATIVPTNTTYTWSATLPAGITGTASGTTNAATGIAGTLTNSTNAPIDVVYTVTTSSAYGPCSGTTFTVTVTVNPRPAIPNQVQAICSGNTFSVVPQNGVPTSATIVPTDITYNWSATLPVGITGTASGTTNAVTGITGTLTNSTNAPIDVLYNITTSSAYGPCSGTSFTVTITVNPRPAIPNQSTIMCSGNPFSVVPQNGIPDAATIVPTNTTYTWSATLPAGITGTASGTTNAATGIAGTLTNSTNAPIDVVYTVTTSSAYGPCTGNTFTVTVTVNPRPSIPNQATSICTGGTFTVIPQNSAPDATTIVPSDITYNWSATLPGGITGTASGTTNATTGITGILSNSTNAPINVVYNVTTSSAYGPCSGTSFTVTVTVNPTPVLNASQTGTVCGDGTTGVSYSFTGAIIPSGITYIWNLPALSDVTMTGGVANTGVPASFNPGNFTNTTTAVQTAIYTGIVPSFAGCVGNSFNMTISVSPSIAGSAVWLGTADNNWCNNANWACGKIPDASTTAIIPAGTTTMPVIDCNASVFDLDLRGTTTLQVGSSGILAVYGDFVNKNPSSYTMDGKVVFAGGAQLIPGFTYQDIQIAGGGVKTLFDDVVINGMLTLINGIVKATTTNTLTIGYDGDVSAAYDNAHIEGPLTRLTHSIGSFSFPVGTLSKLSQAVITTVSADPASYTVTYNYGNDINTGGTAGTSLFNYLNDFNWKVEASGGTDAFKAIPAFSYDPSGFSNTVSSTSPAPEWSVNLTPCIFCNVAVVKYQSGMWYYTGDPDSTITYAGWTPSQSTYWLSPFMISSRSPLSNNVSGVYSFGTGYLIVLPVVLQNFEGKLLGKDGLLQWSFSTDADLAKTELEYSTDGRNFRKISENAAMHHNAGYSYLHTGLADGPNYYRLKIWDKSGKSFYSKTVVLVAGKAVTVIKGLRPTMVSASTYLDALSAKAQTASLLIFDAAGRVVAEHKIRLVAGENTTPIAVTQLVQGMYTVHVKTEDGVIANLRFVKN